MKIMAIQLKYRRKQKICRFRTNNKVIDDIEGGDYTLIEKEAYLIRADEKTVTIKLESESKRYYYE